MRRLDAVLEQLRKPRYLALSAVMLLVAMLCIAAGTWQVFRFIQKRDDNALLRHNAHAPVAPVANVLVPTTATDAEHQASQTRFRRVRAVGTYDISHQLLVRERTVDGVVGFLVLTPFRTTSGTVLLMVRGFVAADGNRPTPVADPPTGRVTVVARAEAPELRNDHFGKTAAGQITAINTVSAADRLGAPAYQSFAELLSHQRGGAKLTPIPDPDLSNPAGGAVEPQHLAYVLQWYFFALLALAAPIVMARAESCLPELEPEDFGAATAIPAMDESERDRAARLADRYGGTRRT
jgi:cytochrome oxidase assembly protein ShyY1